MSAPARNEPTPQVDSHWSYTPPPSPVVRACAVPPPEAEWPWRDAVVRITVERDRIVWEYA